MTRLRPLLWVALALLSVSCREAAAPAPEWAAVQVVRAGAERRERATPTVYAEIAATDEKRQRGLGGRPRLAPDGGMLFVYAERRPRLFWMKDCLISLDIAFLEDDGRIARLATLPPGAGQQDPPAVRSRVAVRYVLEAAGGWFDRHGVETGDRVDLSAVLEGVAPE